MIQYYKWQCISECAGIKALLKEMLIREVSIIKGRKVYRTMNYIVMDLEWNQSAKNNSDNDLLFEIIEIGAVKLNQDMKKIGTYQRLIKPVVYKKIHPIIANLTGLKEGDFTCEKDFKYVIHEFLKWCGEDYVICTFGSQDIYELECNMKYYGCEIPWKYPFKYIDVQKIYAVGQENLCEQRSLESVVNFYHIRQSNVYHRALGDAAYTAEILKRLDRKDIGKYMSLEHFNLPRNRQEIREINLGTHLEYLSEEYEDKEVLLKNPDIYVTRCMECGKKCRKKIKWFSDTAKYLCIAKCEEHGFIQGVLNVKKTYGNGGYYVVRKVSMVDKDKMQSIAEKKAAIREKRRQKRHNKQQ